MITEDKDKLNNSETEGEQMRPFFWDFLTGMDKFRKEMSNNLTEEEADKVFQDTHDILRFEILNLILSHLPPKKEELEAFLAKVYDDDCLAWLEREMPEKIDIRGKIQQVADEVKGKVLEELAAPPS
jgi:hypothetical protein